MTEEQKKDIKNVTPYWSKKNRNRSDLEPVSDFDDEEFKLCQVSDTAFVKAAMEMRAEEEAKKPKEEKELTPEELEILNAPNLSSKVEYDVTGRSEIGVITPLEPIHHPMFPEN